MRLLRFLKNLSPKVLRGKYQLRRVRELSRRKNAVERRLWNQIKDEEKMITERFEGRETGEISGELLGLWNRDAELKHAAEEMGARSKIEYPSAGYKQLASDLLTYRVILEKQLSEGDFSRYREWIKKGPKEEMHACKVFLENYWNPDITPEGLATLTSRNSKQAMVWREGMERILREFSSVYTDSYGFNSSFRVYLTHHNLPRIEELRALVEKAKEEKQKNKPRIEI